MDIDTLTEVCLERVKERKALLEKCRTEEEIGAWRSETLDRYRIDLEPYLWQYFMLHYGQQLDNFWKSHIFPKKSKYAWTIIERRCHPNLWFLLRNIAWAGPSFSLYIFCSDENYDFIRALLGDKVESVNIIKIFKGFATRQEGKDQYAGIFKHAGFYKLIDAEYMIRAEPDTYLRHKVPESVFTGDFYGAPWAWKLDMPGGGGLHIRKIQTMIELCTRANHMGWEGEDSWLGEKIMEYGYPYPPLEFRKTIFSENFPVEDPIGVHQFWTFLENFEISNPPKFKEYLRRYLTIYINE
jgi:hypothetical protein